MEFYSILDSDENVYGEIVVFQNGSCCCYYCSDGALLIYSSLDKIINNLPTNFLIIKDYLYSEDEDY